MDEEINLIVGGDDNIITPRHIGKYNIVKQIGYGSFAAVVLVRHQKTNQIFACKIVKRETLVQENMFGRFEQEVRLMQTFDHPNIIKIEDVIYDEQCIYVIMEYCLNGELFTYMSSTCFLPEREVCRVLRQILSALEYIHEKKIAHRDIKPENILLDRNMNVKLCDFGLCHEMSSDYLLRTPCGSPYYAPPEIISKKQYDGEKSDIWSTGVVAFTMATGVLPWTETNQNRLFNEIIHADITIPSCISPPLTEVLQLMLAKDPNDRPSARELLNMPILQESQPQGNMAPTPLGQVFQKTHNSYSATSHMRSTPEVQASIANLSSHVKKTFVLRPQTASSQANQNVSSAKVIVPYSKKSILQRGPKFRKRVI